MFLIVAMLLIGSCIYFSQTETKSATCHITYTNGDKESVHTTVEMYRDGSYHSSGHFSDGCWYSYPNTRCGIRTYYVTIDK
jgi:hypothetical protein